MGGMYEPTSHNNAVACSPLGGLRSTGAHPSGTLRWVGCMNPTTHNNAVACSPFGGLRSTGAPSIAHFAMGGMYEPNHPQQRRCFGFCPCCCPSFSHYPGIVISTEAAHSLIVSSAAEKSGSPPRPFPATTAHLRLSCRSSSSSTPKNRSFLDAATNRAFCCCFYSRNYFSAFSAQKSHVKHQNHLNA
jgi:hypothetical protein